MDALRAWDSAVEQDHPDRASLFETVATEEGGCLRGLACNLPVEGQTRVGDRLPTDDRDAP